MSSQLDAFQWEVFYRVKSDPVLSAVAVIRQDIGDIETDVMAGLGAFNNGEDEKRGAAVLVMRCRMEVPNRNSVGPLFELVCTARVLEMPLVNRGEGGTGLVASVLTERLLRVLHHYLPKGLGGALTADKRAVEPYDDDLASGIIGWDVHARADGGLATGDRLVAPSISGNAAAVAIAGPGGASVYFTTDGSAPCSANPEATLYVGPFAVGAGTTVRAGAEQAGKVGSDTAARRFDS